MSGPKVDPDHLREQLETFGTPPEIIDETIAAETESATFDVYADNWDVLRVFLALQTQWRIVVGGMARPVFQGLDYASIPPVLDLMDIPAHERAQVFMCLRIMEDAAVQERNRVVSDG